MSFQVSLSFTCLFPSNQGPQGLLMLFCPQGLSSCLQMPGFEPMPPYMEGGARVLGNSRQADLIFPRLSIQLLCDLHIVLLVASEKLPNR